MYKIMSNNMVVDLAKKLHYVRYLKNSKRWIGTDSQSAHGIMGSDGNTVYHLQGRKCICPEELKVVEVYEISDEEYLALESQFAMQHKENEDLRNEIKDLRSQLNEQNSLLQQILAKL